MTKNPSNKGFSNERAKAKEWSYWWTEGADDSCIWRVQGSGGRATQRTKSGKSTGAMYGDLMPVDPKAEPLFRIVTFELKKGYKELDFLDLLDSKSKLPTFWKFWLKLKSDCEESAKSGWGKEPFLILHRDFRHPVICMNSSLYKEICEFHKFKWNKENRVIMISNGIEEIICFRLSVFFEIVHPDFFHRKWNKIQCGQNG